MYWSTSRIEWTELNLDNIKNCQASTCFHPQDTSVRLSDYFTGSSLSGYKLHAARRCKFFWDFSNHSYFKKEFQILLIWRYNCRTHHCLTLKMSNNKVLCHISVWELTWRCAGRSHVSTDWPFKGRSVLQKIPTPQRCDWLMDWWVNHMKGFATSYMHTNSNLAIVETLVLKSQSFFFPVASYSYQLHFFSPFSLP